MLPSPEQKVRTRCMEGALHTSARRSIPVPIPAYPHLAISIQDATFWKVVGLRIHSGPFELHSVSTVGDSWRMLVLWSKFTGKIRIRGHHKISMRWMITDDLRLTKPSLSTMLNVRSRVHAAHQHRDSDSCPTPPEDNFTGRNKGEAQVRLP